ncbi:MAG: dethiobiotin synthase [Paraclostridium sp.]
MSNGIFIIGTDTDVGKTYVSALLMKKLIENKINATYYKAVLSGAYEEDDKLIPYDAKYVCDTSGLKEDYENIVSYSFKTPVSPHLASIIENKDIDLNKIESDFNKLKSKYEYILVEGSGGIICPIKINEKETILLEDIIKMTGFDVLLVTRASVGTINHTVLTVNYLKSKNINMRGIIVNEYDENNEAHIDNVKIIKKLTNVDIVSLVKKSKTHVDNIDIDLDILKL